MKIKTKHFAEPLNVISDQPLQFIVWFFVAIVLGLSGFWLPILSAFLKSTLSWPFMKLSIQSGVLASFSVVILADGIATMLVTVGGGSNLIASGMRGLFGVFAILLSAIHLYLLSQSSDKLPNAYIYFQVLITVLAIILAAYLYCFRSPSWEKSVDDVKKAEEKNVDDLGKTATTINSDREGTAL